MAKIVTSESMSLLSPMSASSPQSSPKMSSRELFAAQSPCSRPTVCCLEQQKPKQLSELAMPSPVSTPGAEHMSDVSSCCSVDDVDSNWSSPPGSPTNSFSTPASDLKRKYRLWSAIRSDYHYLMDEEIIESCRPTESDLSFDSDDHTASVTVVSFKEFLQQYNELSSWLDALLQKARRQCNCLSEKYVNQAFHEDMLSHLMSLKLFKEYVRELIGTHPHLKDDISQHLKQVNGMWEALERLLLPNANHSDQGKMLHDMELDFDGLRQWVDDMEVKRRTWRLHSHWTNDDLDRHLEMQRVLQGQIESHSRVVNALLSLCNRLTAGRDDAENGSKVSMEDQSRADQLKDQVTDVQQELNAIWLNSLEWQMTLEHAKKNGIHLRSDAEDDQWDRMRSTGQRKQMSELDTVHELSSDFVSDEDSFFLNNCSPRKKKSNSENDSSVKNYDSDVPVNEFLTGVDAGDYDLSGNSYLQVPVDCSSRSYSDPLLIGEPCDGKGRGGANRNHPDCRSDLKTDLDPVDAEDLIGNWEDDSSREWSPGQLRRCGAIDLMAAFCEEKREVPVDVGYSSGSHSNEETDSSARQELFIWPQNQRPSIRDSLIYANESAIVKEKVLNSFADRCRNAQGEKKTGGREVLNPSAKVLGGENLCLEAVDELSLPETEDEMSVELPLDDVPVVRSSDLRGSALKAVTPLRRHFRFVEDVSASDFDSSSQAKVSVPNASSPKKKHGTGKLENDPKTQASEKMNGGKVEKMRLLRCSTPLSGSCYASSEGTESESDFITNQNLQIGKHERKFGPRLKSRWNVSSSLRSSPVRELVELNGGRSPLKRRMSDGLESVLSDHYELEVSRHWMSDSQLLREDALSPNKIPKMSFNTSHFLKSSSVGDFHSSSKRMEDLVKRANNDGDIPGKLKPSDRNKMMAHMSVFLGSEEDAVVPSCDSLNSSLTELTADDCQLYNSDYEKMGDEEEEMQWHDDDDYNDGDIKKSIKSRNVAHDLAMLGRRGMDSDSDLEDFRHVLNESGKGLKFIETMIRQDYSFGENDISSQDPASFNEPLATCKTNIVCLQELIDALRSKNKMDGEILQVTEIVTRWQQLQSALLLLQKESLRTFEFQAGVTEMQVELQSLSAATERGGDKFCSVQQLEEAVRAVKNVQFELNEKTDLRFHALDVAYKQFACDRGDLDPQLFAFREQMEQLKMHRNSIAKRCEAKAHALQSALISWHKFNNMEKELNSLLHRCTRASAVEEATSAEASLEEELGDLEAMKTDWRLVDERLLQLRLIYLDFASVCSDSSVLALKQAITISSDQLQTLRQANDERLMQLVKARREPSFPEAVGHQVAANRTGIVSPVRPVNYILPLTLAFVLVSCLYALFGDSWYELLGTLGLVLDPNLKHTRGPPPS